VFFLNMVIASAMLIYGYFAVFQSKRLIDYNLRKISTSETIFSCFQKRIMEKKWFHWQMKVCGVLIILIACLIVYVSISALKHPVK